MQLVGLIFVTFIGTAVGLSCYSCNSYNDTACDDFFSGESEALKTMFAVTCPPSNLTEEPFCRKTKLYLYHPERSNALRVYRECAYGYRHGFHDTSCYFIRQEDYYGEICQCYGDNCNGAPHTALWAPLLMLGAVAGLTTLRATV